MRTASSLGLLDGGISPGRKHAADDLGRRKSMDRLRLGLNMCLHTEISTRLWSLGKRWSGLWEPCGCHQHICGSYTKRMGEIKLLSVCCCLVAD